VQVRATNTHERYADSDLPSRWLRRGSLIDVKPPGAIKHEDADSRHLVLLVQLFPRNGI
jgi:hypothetical protein